MTDFPVAFFSLLVVAHFLALAGIVRFYTSRGAANDAHKAS